MSKISKALERAIDAMANERKSKSQALQETALSSNSDESPAESSAPATTEPSSTEKQRPKRSSEASPDSLDGFDPIEEAMKRFGLSREEAIEISSAHG